MEFLKKHYEKILLSLVLLGLGVAAAYLPALVKETETRCNIQVEGPKGRDQSTNALPPLDFSKEQQALASLTNPPSLNLSGEHRLVNPFTWKLKPDKTLLKVLKEGPDALVFKSAPKPLYTVIAFERASGMTNGYFISTQQQSVKRAPEFAKVNEKSKSQLFTLRGVEGPAEDPTGLIIELADTGEKVTITKSQPYKQVDGYVVDLNYPPENKDFKEKKVNETLTFAGDVYKIVYIGNNEVRVQANQTRKQTTIFWTGKN
jgi:hypothetical protein